MGVLVVELEGGEMTWIVLISRVSRALHSSSESVCRWMLDRVRMRPW